MKSFRASTRLTSRHIRFLGNQKPGIEFVHYDDPMIANREARRIVVKVWSALGIPSGERVVSVVWVNTRESRRLNVLYRGRERATNVLSFEYGTSQGIGASEIVLCSPVIRREASELGIEVRVWAARLLIHGLLHAEGYRHDSKLRRRRMERIELAILKACGYPPAMIPIGR